MIRARWVTAAIGLSLLMLAAGSSSAYAEIDGGGVKKPAPSPPDGPADPLQSGGSAIGDVLSFLATSATGESARVAKSGAASATRQPQYRRGGICGVDTGGFEPGPNFSDEPCPRQGAPVPRDCGDDEPIEPLWMREPDATDPDGWGPWQMVSGWACPEDLLPPFTETDLRRLRIPAPVLAMQPSRGWVLVNKDTIAYADHAARTYRTSLLGHPLTVVATPHEYTWDWGDGTRSTTTSAGHAYPDQDVAHVYRSAGTGRIAVTVTWTATYQYDGYPTVHDVNGTATTTASTAPFDVIELHSQLVSGTCDQDPHGPGC